MKRTKKKKKKHTVEQFKCYSSVLCLLNAGLAMQNGLELYIKICRIGKKKKAVNELQVYKWYLGVLSVPIYYCGRKCKKIRKYIVG